jgi:hypothetical protein
MYAICSFLADAIVRRYEKGEVPDSHTLIVFLGCGAVPGTIYVPYMVHKSETPKYGT